MEERQRQGARPELIKELVKFHAVHLERLVDQGVLSALTIEHYARFTRRLADEYGDVPIHTVAQCHLEQLLEIWSNTANAHNNALRSLKHLFSYASKRWSIRPNPAASIRKMEIKTDGFTPWTEEQVRKYLDQHQIGSKAYLTMMLLLHCAPRLSDLVKLGPGNLVNIDGVDCLSFKPQKTQSVTVTVPLHPNLRAAIEATTTGDQTFLITAFGNPHSPKAFGNKIAGWRKEAGITESVSAHGLRKTVGINMAENGATEYQLMAALGHTTPKVTEVYTRAARRNLLSFEAAAKSTLGNIIHSKENKDDNND